MTYGPQVVQMWEPDVSLYLPLTIYAKVKLILRHLGAFSLINRQHWHTLFVVQPSSPWLTVLSPSVTQQASSSLTDCCCYIKMWKVRAKHANLSVVGLHLIPTSEDVLMQQIHLFLKAMWQKCPHKDNWNWNCVFLLYIFGLLCQCWLVTAKAWIDTGCLLTSNPVQAVKYAMFYVVFLLHVQQQWSHSSNWWCDF